MALPQTVTTTEMSKLFGVSGKTVAAWATAGIIVRVGRGKFNLAKSISSVLKHHKRSGSETTVAAAVGSERARLLKAQADRAEMQLKLEVGELLRTSEVRHETLRTFYVVRSGVMAAKARIGNRLPHMSRLDLVEIDDELRGALTELGQNKYNIDTEWTVRPTELAEQLGLPVEAVDRFAKAGVLSAPDSEGRLSLWGSVRALVTLAQKGGSPAARAFPATICRPPRGQPPLSGAP
jgi:phage terminase Nu1 subunit (DNA packaging protein)